MRAVQVYDGSGIDPRTIVPMEGRACWTLEVNRVVRWDRWEVLESGIVVRCETADAAIFGAEPLKRYRGCEVFLILKLPTRRYGVSGELTNVRVPTRTNRIILAFARKPEIEVVDA